MKTWQTVYILAKGIVKDTGEEKIRIKTAILDNFQVICDDGTVENIGEFFESKEALVSKLLKD